MSLNCRSFGGGVLTIRHLATVKCRIRRLGACTATCPRAPMTPRGRRCSAARRCRTTCGRCRRSFDGCVRGYGSVRRQVSANRLAFCVYVKRGRVALYCVTDTTTGTSVTARGRLSPIRGLRRRSGHGGRVTIRGAITSTGGRVLSISASRDGFARSRRGVVCFFLLSSLHERRFKMFNVKRGGTCRRLRSRRGVGVVTGLATGRGTIVHESFLVSGFGNTCNGGTTTALLLSFTHGRVPSALTRVRDKCGRICRGHRGHVRRHGTTLLTGRQRAGPRRTTRTRGARPATRMRPRRRARPRRITT